MYCTVDDFLRSQVLGTNYKLGDAIRTRYTQSSCTTYTKHAMSAEMAAKIVKSSWNVTSDSFKHNN